MCLYLYCTIEIHKPFNKLENMETQQVNEVLVLIFSSVCGLAVIIAFFVALNGNEKEFKIGCNAEFNTDECDKDNCSNCQLWGVKAIDNEG